MKYTGCVWSARDFLGGTCLPVPEKVSDRRWGEGRLFSVGRVVPEIGGVLKPREIARKKKENDPEKVRSNRIRGVHYFFPDIMDVF